MSNEVELTLWVYGLGLILGYILKVWVDMYKESRI